MDTVFDLKGSIIVEPVWWNDPPKISIHLDEHLIYAGQILGTQEFAFSDRVNSGPHTLSVQFNNKTDQDTDLGKKLDKAVMIKKIRFFGIESPHFVWNGVYVPEYPESYANQCREQGTTLPTVLKYHDYLGWNGKWSLTFDVPIFSWIHKIENLGWIYD